MADEDATRSDSNQLCAICLEDLLGAKKSLSSETSKSSNVGALVPCGHCFHVRCYQRWAVVSSLASARHGTVVDEDCPTCKCPLCNMAADRLMRLFISPIKHDGNIGANDNIRGDQQHFANQEQERVKAKLKHYKKRSKLLKKELLQERKETEEVLVTTIQTFYNILQEHDKDRRHWQEQTENLRQELNLTRSQQLEERRQLHGRHERMHEEMELIQQKCDESNCRMEKAAQGMADIGRHQKGQQAKFRQLVTENDKLVDENKQLRDQLAAIS